MPIQNPAGKTSTVRIDGTPVKIASGYRKTDMTGTTSQAKFFVQTTNGYFAIGRTCTICGFGLTRQKERNPGRGWGMREGNILRGKMIRHVRENHPQLIDRPMSN